MRVKYRVRYGPKPETAAGLMPWALVGGGAAR